MSRAGYLTDQDDRQTASVLTKKCVVCPRPIMVLTGWPFHVDRTVYPVRRIPPGLTPKTLVYDSEKPETFTRRGQFDQLLPKTRSA
jgi:hypothetical protein